MSIPKTSAGSGNIYLGSNLIAEGGCGRWEYSYDFKNKSINQITADGWSSTQNTPAFNADGIGPSVSNKDIMVTIALWENLNNANKVTIITDYKWGDTQGGGNYSIADIANGNKRNGFYSQGTARSINLNDTTVWSINNASDSAGTYSETMVMDLVNKTYNLSGHFSQSGSLTDTQIASIKATTGIRIGVFKSTNMKFSQITVVVE